MSTHHKLRRSLIYKLTKGEKEICVVCHEVITIYSIEPILEINKKYFESYPRDIMLGNILYHTCSDTCKDLFLLNPLMYEMSDDAK